MVSPSLPSTPFRPAVLMGLAGGIAILNAAISMLIVALATPGSGVIGTGFQVITYSFVFGNLATLVTALVLARHSRRFWQLTGLGIQLLAVPLSIALAFTILSIFGISEL